MGSRKLSLRSLNLNLLVVFDAMMTERNATRAGQVLSLSQSAISNSLAQLRSALNDPLFIRVRNEMMPTARASSLAVPIRNALAQLRVAIAPVDVFAPDQSARVFRIGMTDYCAFILLAGILREIHRQSQGIKIIVHNVTAETTLTALDSGDADICLGLPNAGDERHHADHLFDDEWVCARARGSREPFQLSTYLAANHVVVGDRLCNHVDRRIKDLGLARKNIVSLPYCLVAPTLVETSNLMLTLPRRLAVEFRRGRRIEILELPFAMRRFSVHAVWHTRLHQDPGICWLREVIRQASLDRSLTAAVRSITSLGNQ